MTVLLLAYLALQPNHLLYPWWEPLRDAFGQWDALTRLYSDYPEVYRWTWSLQVSGPCPETLHTGGSDPWRLPCDVLPVLPTELQLPSVLYVQYQHLTYTAPEDPDHPKARLALSYKYVLVSAGVIWELSVDSSGLTHDVYWCVYQPRRTTIYLTPLIPLRVTVLRPASYLHFSLRSNGEWSLTEHQIQQWNLPFQLVAQAATYDVLPAAPTCGTVGYRYTTKVGEVLNGVMQSLVPDAAEIQGERQIVVTPASGVGNCGRYSYALFSAFMSHRFPATPSYGQDGPPLEVWSLGGQRDLARETEQVIHGERTDHGRVTQTQRELQSAGLGGPFQRDSDLASALEEQAGTVQQRYKKSADRGDQALILLDMLAADPTNAHLLELLVSEIAPNSFRLDHLGDSTIEFNPYRHCEIPAVEGTVPFWGSHFLMDGTPDPCHFCTFHDMIVRQPMRSWSHARLLDMEWVFAPIHGHKGNLYEHAYEFIRAHIWDRDGDQKQGVHDRLERLTERQLSDVHQDQIQGTRLEDLERATSEATPNRARARYGDDLPPLFRREASYDPCLDPSYTIQYLVLYGEILDIFDGPCGLLWAVE